MLAAAVAANAASAQSTLTLEEARRLAPATARHEVTAAWLAAWSAARAEPLVRSLKVEQQRSVDAARGAVAAGRGALADVYAARQLLNQSEDRLLELAMQAERANAELERWTGGAAMPAAAAPQWKDPAPLARLLAKFEDKSIQVELKVAYSEWRRSAERLANYDGHILPDAQARVDALAAAYGAGRGELGPMLQARQALVESRLRRLAIELERAKARATLEHFERAP